LSLLALCLGELARPGELIAVKPTISGEFDDWASRLVIRLLTDRVDIDAGPITPDRRLSDLLIDSLDFVELFMALEDELQVHVDEPSSPIVTVAELIEIVRKSKS
jgi:acyl carrier protein